MLLQSKGHKGQERRPTITMKPPGMSPLQQLALMSHNMEGGGRCGAFSGHHFSDILRFLTDEVKLLCLCHLMTYVSYT